MNEELAKKYLEALFECFPDDIPGMKYSYWDDENNNIPVSANVAELLDEIAEFLYRGEAEPIEE